MMFDSWEDDADASAVANDSCACAASIVAIVIEENTDSCACAASSYGVMRATPSFHTVLQQTTEKSEQLWAPGPVDLVAEQFSKMTRQIVVADMVRIANFRIETKKEHSNMLQRIAATQERVVTASTTLKELQKNCKQTEQLLQQAKRQLGQLGQVHEHMSQSQIAIAKRKLSAEIKRFETQIATNKKTLEQIKCKSSNLDCELLQLQNDASRQCDLLDMCDKDILAMLNEADKKQTKNEKPKRHRKPKSNANVLDEDFEEHFELQKCKNSKLRK